MGVQALKYAISISSSQNMVKLHDISGHCRIGPIYMKDEPVKELMLRKLNTECRNQLLAETITAYLQCKINFDSCCPKFQVSSAMLRDAKHACYDNKLESEVNRERYGGGDLL